MSGAAGHCDRAQARDQLRQRGHCGQQDQPHPVARQAGVRGNGIAIAAQAHAGKADQAGAQRKFQPDQNDGIHGDGSQVVKGLTPAPAPGFFKFYRHADQRRSAQADAQLGQAQGLGLEDRVEHRHVNGRHLQHKSQQHGAQQRLVAAQAEFPERFALGTDRHHMRHLGQREHGEHHGLPVGVASGQGPGLHPQAQAGNQQANAQNVLPHAIGKQALGVGAGRALHDTALRRFRRQRQAGQAVGDQIDPQDVDRQQRNRQKNQRCQKQRPDLARVAGHGVAHKLADVVVNAPALAHRRHDGGKVVVQQHHAGGLTRHVGAALAHGHANVGALEGRGIVHAIAGHGDNFALRLQGFHNADFLRRIDPGVDLHLHHALQQGRIVQRGQVLPGQHLRLRVGHDAQALRNGARGGRMVAGDHDRRDARADAVTHGGGGLGARRVDQRDQTEKLQVLFDFVGRQRVGQIGVITPRQSQHAQALCRQAVRLVDDTLGVKRQRAIG